MVRRKGCDQDIFETTTKAVRALPVPHDLVSRPVAAILLDIRKLNPGRLCPTARRHTPTLHFAKEVRLFDQIDAAQGKS